MRIDRRKYIRKTERGKLPRTQARENITTQIKTGLLGLEEGIRRWLSW